MRNIIWKKPDGGIAITTITQIETEEGLKYTAESIPYAEQLKNTPEFEGFEPVAFDTPVNIDPEFRNAYVATENEIKIDLVKARGITKNRLRKQREPLLAALDVESTRALEDGLPLDDIKVKKQRLRDITKLADKAVSVEELKQISVSEDV
jgi:hypothetical protein